MRVVMGDLPGLRIIEPRIFEDARGEFFENWHEERYGAAGISEHFVQDNVSRSTRGVLRGLHYQQPNAQGKLISVLLGEVWDVAVDIRHGSPTFGQWFGIALSAAKRQQLYIAPGFAHGFQVTSDEALVLYKCTRHYDHAAERSVLWSDEDLGIPWPLAPILSDKDRTAARLRDIPASALPPYIGT